MPQGAGKTQNLEKIQTEHNLQKEFLKNQYMFIKTQKKWSPLNKNNLLYEKNEEIEHDIRLKYPEFEDEFEEDLRKINQNEPFITNFNGNAEIRSKKSLNKPKIRFTKEHSNKIKNTKFREQIDSILEKCTKNYRESNEIKNLEKNLQIYNNFFDNKLDHFSKKYLK